MSETVFGLFSKAEQAHHAVVELDMLGVPRANIGYITGDPEIHGSISLKEHDIKIGIEAGAVTGGATGFLLGLTAFAIPFATPLVAAGTLAALVAGGSFGAALGGLIGTFVHHGVDNGQAQLMSKHVQAGGTVIAVHVEPSMAVAARQAIEKFGGSTSVDDIPDAGTIPDDPLEFSEEATGLQTDEDPISELGSSRQDRV